MSTKRGFTLIELLVVIAIIGILSSVVLASLNSAREKSRDAKKVSDIKQVQLALELYFDSNSEYPDADVEGLQELVDDGFMPAVPADVTYVPLGAESSTVGGGDHAAADVCLDTETCLFYHLFVGLEDQSGNHSAVAGDADYDSSAAAGGGATGINGLTVACTDGADAADGCYDVTP